MGGGTEQFLVIFNNLSNIAVAWRTNIGIELQNAKFLSKKLVRGYSQRNVCIQRNTWK